MPMDFERGLQRQIANLQVPHVLRSFQLRWPIFDADFESWCRLFDEHHAQKEVQFDAAPKGHHDVPYWERFRKHESMTMMDFVHKSKDDSKWYTYSYKDIDTWPEPLRQGINFEALGFDDAKDVLFWIGSKGANTPCHYDTYGFNIVVQVFGRKRWLLFPPDTPMDITRVPYEESSVYCKQNFYSPKEDSQIPDTISSRCHAVTLGPGDILIVPNRWWHYVECLDATLAINTWIPMDEHDTRANLEECFVKNIILKAIDSCSNGVRARILNPNEANDDISVSYHELAHAIGEMILDKQSKRHKRPATSPQEPHEEEPIREALQSLNLTPVALMPRDEFVEIMRENSSRYKSDEEYKKARSKCAECGEFKMVERMINAMCHPKVMQTSCDLYLDALRKEKDNAGTI